MATLSSVKPTRIVYLELPTVILVQGSFQLSKLVDDLWPKDIVRFISSLHFAAIYKDSLPFASLINNILTLYFGSPAGSNLQGACRGRHSPYGGTVRCEAITESSAMPNVKHRGFVWVRSTLERLRSLNCNTVTIGFAKTSGA